MIVLPPDHTVIRESITKHLATSVIQSVAVTAARARQRDPPAP